jgi:hypothetical protein
MQHVWLGYYMDCEKIAQISWLVREDAYVGNRENFLSAAIISCHLVQGIQE